MCLITKPQVFAKTVPNENIWPCTAEQTCLNASEIWMILCRALLCLKIKISAESDINCSAWQVSTEKVSINLCRVRHNLLRTKLSVLNVSSDSAESDRIRLIQAQTFSLGVAKILKNIPWQPQAEKGQVTCPSCQEYETMIGNPFVLWVKHFTHKPYLCLN